MPAPNRFKTDIGERAYLPALFDALQATQGEVLNIGIDDHVTDLLHAYCNRHGRWLTTYDTDEAKVEKWKRRQGKFHRVLLVKHYETALYSVEKAGAYTVSMGQVIPLPPNTAQVGYRKAAVAFVNDKLNFPAERLAERIVKA